MSRDVEQYWRKPSKQLQKLVANDERFDEYDWDEYSGHWLVLADGYIWSGWDTHSKRFDTVKEALKTLYRIEAVLPKG